MAFTRRHMFKIKKYALAFFSESNISEIIATQHICSKEPKIGNKENMKFRQGVYEGTIIALNGESISSLRFYCLQITN